MITTGWVTFSTNTAGSYYYGIDYSSRHYEVELSKAAQKKKWRELFLKHEEELRRAKDRHRRPRNPVRERRELRMQTQAAAVAVRQKPPQITYQ